MSAVRTPSLADLYEADETLWLEETARLVSAGRFDAIDAVNLAEYLTSMSIRDRRQVMSRLVVLLKHLLKWDVQPARRSGGWEATVIHQRFKLVDILTSGTLRRHAEEELPRAYGQARNVAGAETGLGADAFPADCPFDLGQVLSRPLAK